MALIHFDGFDVVATADLSKEYTVTSTIAIAVGSTAGRRGGGGLQAPSSSLANTASAGTIAKSLGANLATVVFGFSFKANAFPQTGTNWGIAQLVDGGSIQCGLSINSSGQINAFRTTPGTILGTTTNALATGTEYYIEAKFTISDAAGTVDIKVNGNSWLSLSSVDTKNTANAYASILAIGGFITGTQSAPPTALTFTYDDFYILDTTGSAPHNDFLGDVRVDAVYPDGDGNYSQFTPSTGTTHYTLVDDATPNTTDYVSDSTVGHKDSYTMQNPTLNSNTIYAVKPKVAALKDDAGTRSLKVGVRSSTTDSVSAAQALSTTQAYYSNIMTTDPATGVAWTASGINAMEVLVEVA